MYGHLRWFYLLLLLLAQVWCIPINIKGRETFFLEYSLDLFLPLLEKTLESPLDCKEIQPVHSEGDQPWVFFGGNDAKAETPVLWPPHGKS